jgi:hypothetical protein
MTHSPVKEAGDFVDFKVRLFDALSVLMTKGFDPYPAFQNLSDASRVNSGLAHGCRQSPAELLLTTDRQTLRADQTQRVDAQPLANTFRLLKNEEFVRVNPDPVPPGSAQLLEGGS